MPQYSLYRQIGYGMRAEYKVIVFLAKDNADALAQVARDLGITLKNGMLDEWEFYSADANSLFCDGVQVFPKRPVSALVLT